MNVPLQAWPAKIVTHSTTLRPRQLSHSQSMRVANKSVDNNTLQGMNTMSRKKGKSSCSKRNLYQSQAWYWTQVSFEDDFQFHEVGCWYSSGHCPPSQSTTRTSSWTPASTSTLLEHFISHVPFKIQTTSHIETCVLQFYIISLQYHVLHESSGVSSMPPSMDLVRRVIQALENVNRKKLHRLWQVIGLGGCG